MISAMANDGVQAVGEIVVAAGQRRVQIDGGQAQRCGDLFDFLNDVGHQIGVGPPQGVLENRRRNHRPDDRRTVERAEGLE